MNAVLHTEPTFVAALQVVGREIVPVTLTGLRATGGTVPWMPFSENFDAAVGRQVVQVMNGRDVVVWENRGLLVVGSSLCDALERTLVVEESARVLAIASQLGTPKTLQFPADSAAQER